MIEQTQDSQADETLPVMLDAAQRALAGARTSAELLEARDRAAATYDAARRFTQRKSAFDHLCGVAMRMQAQALRIEARAKERLADEYDAAQERGEVAKSGQRNDLVVDHNEVKPTAADLGLRRDQIHEARRIRDAERADPGAIDRSIEGALARNEAPTRTQLRRDLRVYRDDAPQDEAHQAVLAQLCRRLATAIPADLAAILAGDWSDDSEFSEAVCAALASLSRSDRENILVTAAAVANIARCIEDHEPA